MINNKWGAIALMNGTTCFTYDYNLEQPILQVNSGPVQLYFPQSSTWYVTKGVQNGRQ